MNAELIAVGTELLLGQISDTDCRDIARRLASIGINVYYFTAVGDNPSRLRSVLELAKSRSDLIITTGGLGPTYDDLTKETICEVFEQKLFLHEPSLERIRSFFASRGKVMTDNNIKQAMLPEGCTVFDNDWGTAPGCGFIANGKTVAMLPGPPRECVPMCDFRLMPFLTSLSDKVLYSDTVRVCGAGESEVESRLKDLMSNSLNPTVAPYCQLGEVEIRVTSLCKTPEEGKQLNTPAIEQIRRELKDDVYGINVPSLADALILRLRELGLTLSVAESGTGGLCAKRITDTEDGPDIFRGGIVSNSEDTLTGLLGVDPDTLSGHGRFCEAVAGEMAAGVCRILKSDIGLAFSGNAGPDGGTETVPVGTVCIGICLRGQIFTKTLAAGGRTRFRADIRELSVTRSLKLILDLLKEF